MRLKLISNARECWKWSSVRFGVIAGILAQAWFEYPALQAIVPPDKLRYIAAAAAVLAIIARITRYETNK